MKESEKGFRIYLPSDVPTGKIYDNVNTLSHYFTILPNRIFLEGEWEVALEEIIFPLTVHNIEKKRQEIILRKKISDGDLHFELNTRLYLPTGSFNPRQLVLVLNKLISTATLKGMKGKEYKNRKMGIKFRYSTSLKRFEIQIPAREEISVSEDLGKMLGCKVLERTDTISFGNAQHNNSENNEEKKKQKMYTWNFSERPRKEIAKNFPMIDSGIEIMYVYVDFVDPSLVGNTRVQILRTIHFSGAMKEKISLQGISTTKQEFTHLHFFKVSKSSLSQIEVGLCTSKGEEFNFYGGKTLLTLYFRPKTN